MVGWLGSRFQAWREAYIKERSTRSFQPDRPNHSTGRQSRQGKRVERAGRERATRRMRGSRFSHVPLQIAFGGCKFLPPEALWLYYAGGRGWVSVVKGSKSKPVPQANSARLRWREVNMGVMTFPCPDWNRHLFLRHPIPLHP